MDFRQYLAALLSQMASGTEFRFDANETAALERQLTYLRTQVHEVQYADLVARSFVPQATDIPASAETYSQPVLDYTGAAAIISTGAMDIPRVDIALSEGTGKIYDIADAYGFYLRELAEAARVGNPLQQWKANAARRAIDEAIDGMLAVGAPPGVAATLNTTGLINNAAVIAQGIASLTHWVQGTTTGLDIADEMHAFVNGIVIGSLQKFIPNTLLLPPSRYNIAATTLIASTETTALASFLKNSPYITAVAQWHKLEDAGVGGLDRAIAYRRDPMVLESIVPQDFAQLAPERRGLEMVTICTARAGGVRVYQPKAMLYGDFLDA